VEVCTQVSIQSHYRGYCAQVRQYKLEREYNTAIHQSREEKITRLESLMDGVLSPDDFYSDELAAVKLEHKVCDIVFSSQQCLCPSFFDILQKCCRS